MKIKWLVRADGMRAPGYIESVDDHLGLAWIARGMAEAVGESNPVIVEAMPGPPKKAAFDSPILRGKRN